LQTEPLRLRADEGLEDLFENLVFAQQLMNGCLLLVPEKTELARFVYTAAFAAISSSAGARK
jgi:hypothetical protein